MTSDYLDYDPTECKDCPPAYGGCTCECHTTPGVIHCVPCCVPETDEDKLKSVEWKRYVKTIYNKKQRYG